MWEDHRDNVQVCWIGDPEATAEEEVELLRDVKCSLLEVQWQREG